MNAWKEKLTPLKYKGGFKASLFWIVKVIFRVEIHFLYAIDLANQQKWLHICSAKSETGFRFISLDTAQDIAMIPRDLIDRIGLQSGYSVDQLIKNNTVVYALIDKTNLVSQLNVCRNFVIHIDSPTDLDIRLAPGDTFLGYLFTYPQYRGIGAAALLLKDVCKNIEKQGYQRVVTHIRSTNVSSLNTFNKCGWSRIGWIFTGTKGRFLLAYCPSGTGITVSASARHTY